MPINTVLASQIWNRFQHVRDAGHAEFVRKADKCNDFFIGQQWNLNDMALLQAQRRPALTINKIISTISNVLGEQIHNRSDIAYQARSGAPVQVAETLTKVFRQISDANQLDWKRSDMFCDGVITSRGFLDVRLDFTDSMQGEVKIDNVNPKNVLIDPDAEEFDPDTWNDVFTTKWMTWQDIALLYNRADAEQLKNRSDSFFPYGYDSIERRRDRFGDETGYSGYLNALDEQDVNRNIRVIDRQWMKLDNQQHFVDPKTGDMRPIPINWPPEKVQMVQQQFGLATTRKLVKRVRWTVIADNFVLHDDWSPYKHYTIIPYFPYFRRGRTVGLVENLLGPQEYLNKVTSQELHVINTTANSGWIVQTGMLRNMVIEELEQRGAETGLVIEVGGDPDSVIKKIQPNNTPTGLDRFSYKAEEHIKNISGVTDYMAGNAREDVSAKAVAANTSRGSLNLSKPLDGIARTDYILARNVLDIVQHFYTEPRLLNIVANRMQGDNEALEVNKPDPLTGVILNDLTVGEFDVIVSNTPHRETLEDSQFEQATALRELGVQLPDEVLIENSRLNKRSEIIKQMRDSAQSPEAQYKAQLEKLNAELELAKLKGESARLEADSQLKQAKAEAEQIKNQIDVSGQSPEAQKLQAEMLLKQQEADVDMAMKEQEFELKKQEMELDLDFRRQELELKRQELELKLQGQAVQTGLKIETADAQAGLKMEQMGQAHKQNMQQKERMNAQALKAAKAKAALKPKAKAK